MASNYRCVNFYDLCRLCTACTDEKKCEIFSQEGKHKELSSKIDECLGVEIHEKDQLPKVLCSQCVQHVDNIAQFRTICKSSQAMLNNCLQTATQQQNGGKVYIKDAIVTPSGKSLSVMQGTSALETQQSQQRIQQPITMTDNVAQSFCNQTLTPASGTQLTSLFQQQNNNDFLNSIMQAVGIQALDSTSLTGRTPSVLQQYTIRLDNKGGEVKAEPAEYILPTNEHPTTPSVNAKTPEKETKNNALEEFLRMKPNIKVTPIKKKSVEKHQGNSSQEQKQEHQSQPQELQTPTIQQQVVQQQMQQQTQQFQQSQSATPQQQQFQQQQVAQLQLQQLQQQIQQQLQQQWQQQQLQQQLQQITAQLQSQTQHQLNQQPQQQITISSDDLSSSKNKKPKLNFIISSPTNQALAAPSSNTAAPQIQLHFPTATTTAQQQQQQQSNATAALLQNLAPFLQQQPIMQHNNALSPNKCFLPVTIKDENSDQQIIAHIDAKNFMLPTTYQLQMKLQPQIQTVDGQPIMQLTPTSIPATLQIAPPALSNQTFQAAAAVATTNQQLQQQLQQQQQHFQQQQKSLPQTVQITSQQILATPNKQQTISNNRSNINNTSLNSTHDAATSTTDQNDDAPIFTNSALQQRQPQQLDTTVQVLKPNKYQITQLTGSTEIEISPTTKLTQQIMQQVQNQQKQRKLQQQQQNQQQKQQHQQLQTNTTTTLPTKHGGITVQRITTTKAAAEKAQQAPKLPTLNRQNVTISRISPQQQQQSARSIPKHSQQLKAEASPKRQQQKITNPQQQQPQQIVGTLSQATEQQDLINTINQIEQQQQATVLAKSKIPASNKLTSINKTATSTNTNYNMTATSQTIDSAFQQQQSGNATGNNQLLTNTSNTAHGTGPDGLECSQCGRVFKKKEHLMQHIKLHAGVRPFKCTEEGCNKDFSRKEHLLRHLVSHSGKKLFNCEVCQKLFSRKDNLNKHRRIHSDQPNSSNYTCEICHKSFAIKVYYQQHKLIHEKARAADTVSEVKNEENVVQNSTVTQQTPAMQQEQQQQQQPAQQQHQQIQMLQQHQHPQQQIMQLQLPAGVVTTQDIASNTITITQSNDLNNRSEKSIGSHDTTVLNLPTAIANFVQLGQAQFVNATTGEIMGHIKIEK